METVEQISIPFARVFVLNGKTQNIIVLFKNSSRNKEDNYRPVSLTSVKFNVE